MDDKKIKLIFEKAPIAPVGISYSISGDNEAVIIHFIGFSNDISGDREYHVSESIMLTNTMARDLVENIEKVTNKSK